MASPLLLHGRPDRGSPELLLTGLPHQKAGGVLNPLAHGLMGHGRPPYVAGHLHSWPHLSLEVVDVPEPDVHLVMAAALYGPSLRAVQLVYADDRGHWPWHPGFRGSQPVLGPRALGRIGR